MFGLSEIKMPNAFTPNNDNINDFFNIVTKNEKMYQVVKFNVFNRQGKLIYDNENAQLGWDGKHKDEELISDTYIYLIIVQSRGGQSFKFSGEVLLLR